MWEGHGPLSCVAVIGYGAPRSVAAEQGRGLPLRADGRLAFLHYDGEDGIGMVDPGDPGRQCG